MKSHRTIFAVLLAMTAPALAGPRDDVIAGSARCDGIVDDRTWLDCYYGAAQPLRARLGLAPAPNSQQILVPPARPNAPAPSARLNTPAPTAAPGNAAAGNTARAERPGFFSRMLTHTEIKADPPSRMASYEFGGGGMFVVTLANGQVWRQTIGDVNTARWRARPETYAVTILPGAQFGTNRMKVGNSEVYEVERVR